MDNSDNMIKQYLNSQVNLNDIRMAEVQNDLSSIKNVNQAEEEARQEYIKFKNKLKLLDKITSISEARRIAKDFLPIEKEKTFLKVGNANCVVISRGDLFRVILDSDEEYVCYNIIRK